MSIKLYPVTGKECRHDGYQVKMNGKAVELDAARVSAVPFNRRWPGHQRSKDQTEMVNFLSYAANEPVLFEITPKDSFERVIIRPKSLNIEPEITSEGTIVFSIEKPAYFTVEPYGRRNALHIFGDAMPSYDVDVQENIIYFGAGIHEVGEITLKSNQTLFLDEGAVVYGSVKAVDAEKIRILGRGILDNSHNREVILYEANVENNDAAVNNDVRQHTIQLEYCRDIEIDGITIRDSLVYNIRPIACVGIRIANVKIIGCWRYNSDGIDMHNCENVVIENCFLRTFDDSICVKGFDISYKGPSEQAINEAMYRNGEKHDVFRNVRVRNCTIWNDWGICLEIGAETRAEEMYDIIFEDCDIIHVTSRVLDCCNVDYADVHDICYRNINIEYDDIVPMPLNQDTDTQKYEITNPDYIPAAIMGWVLYHHEYSIGASRRGKNRNLLFENIYLWGRQLPLFRFWGFDREHTCYDVTVRNFYANGKALTEEKDYILETDETCHDIHIELG